MKLREKIDQIDNRIDILNKSVRFLMNKLDVSPADILDAEAELKRQAEIEYLKKKAKELGVKAPELLNG